METGDIVEGAERNTGSGPGATSIVRRSRVLGWLAAEYRWVDLAILLLAAVLRLWALDLKPPHFDEGVNGFFVDEMTKRGCYHYDPTNFHGPLHFYILFVMQTLLGRHVWVLRLPLALAGVACVGLALFGFRRVFSTTACRLAAVAMAVSPGFVFYSRYAIHETWLVLFLMIAVIGVAGLWRDGARKHLWTIGIGLSGTVLMKETWIIHLVAMGLAAFTLRGLEAFSDSAPGPWAPSRWTFDDASRIAAICLGAVLFVYSGCLLDPSGLRGFAEAFANWTKTGMGDSGHDKPWAYWWQLLAIYEWPALIGVAASALVLVPGTNRFLRWLAIFAGGTLAAYTIIAYKTPWCLIAWAWPFFFLFGAAVEKLSQQVDRGVIGGLAAVMLLVSLGKGVTLNFEKYADETEPYVYVQTTDDIHLLLDPLRWLAARDPESMFHVGHVIQPEEHPMRWLFGDRPYVTYGDQDAEPEPMDGDWLLVDKSATDRVEEKLKDIYFRTPLQVRGMSPDRSVIYLRARTFADFFPGREPEFDPAQPHIRLDEVLPDAEAPKPPAKKLEELDR